MHVLVEHHLLKVFMLLARCQLPVLNHSSGLMRSQ